jgi:hypothetical protein
MARRLSHRYVAIVFSTPGSESWDPTLLTSNFTRATSVVTGACWRCSLWLRISLWSFMVHGSFSVVLCSVRLEVMLSSARVPRFGFLASSWRNVAALDSMRSLAPGRARIGRLLEGRHWSGMSLGVPQTPTGASWPREDLGEAPGGLGRSPGTSSGGV